MNINIIYFVFRFAQIYNNGAAVTSGNHSVTDQQTNNFNAYVYNGANTVQNFIFSWLVGGFDQSS